MSAATTVAGDAPATVPPAGALLFHASDRRFRPGTRLLSAHEQRLVTRHARPPRKHNYDPRLVYVYSLAGTVLNPRTGESYDPTWDLSHYDFGHLGAHVHEVRLVSGVLVPDPEGSSPHAWATLGEVRVVRRLAEHG